MEPVNLQLGKNGRLIIPVGFRQALQLSEGDTLIASLNGNRLILETEEALLERLYEAVGVRDEGELASDELIRWRHEVEE
jgi:bifunctional DNA-binding transcriptional regulator/antitoxin component of YhaV-PrlF toxin-antitoxin module